MVKLREKKRNDLFTKILLHTIKMYLDASKNEGIDFQEKFQFLETLRVASSLYSKNYLFYANEVKYLEQQKDEVLKKLINKRISYHFFSLELIRIWVNDYEKKERPTFNISEKKLRSGKSVIWEDMLRLKKASEDMGDMEKYNEIKQTIDASVQAAKEWYEWHMIRFRGIREEDLKKGLIDGYYPTRKIA